MAMKKNLTKTSRRSTPPAPKPRSGAKPDQKQMNQATTEEFEREDMGIAPKE